MSDYTEKFEKMRAAGNLAARTLDMLTDHIKPGISTDEDDDGEKDDLYDEAVAFVAQSRRASISAVQRRLRVGYNRAARIIETMEEAGVVSPMATNGNREVLVPPPPED